MELDKVCHRLLAFSLCFHALCNHIGNVSNSLYSKLLPTCGVPLKASRMLSRTNWLQSGNPAAQPPLDAHGDRELH